MVLALLSVIVAQSSSLDIRSFGARSDGSDATVPIQRALDEARRLGRAKVTVPAGTYIVSNLYLYGKTTLIGEGSTSKLRRKPNSSYHMISINSLNSQSSKDNPNETDIEIRNLSLRDNCTTEQFTQQSHLIKANGVDRLIVSNVDFVGFRGDALYIGSGDASSVVRHNRDIIVEKCRFDGINRNNRNGIAIGDVTGMTITNNYFTRMTSNASPGCIDFEMNKDGGHILRNIKVSLNVFQNNGGSAIIFDIPSGYQDLGAPVTDVTISSNLIQNQQRRGVLVNQWAKMDYSSPRQRIVIRGNRIENTDLPIAVEGTRGVTIQSNTITDCAQGIHVGYGPFGHGAIETTIETNEFRRVGFTDLDNRGSAVILFNVSGVAVKSNNVNEVTSSVVLFRNGKGGGAGKNVLISGNTFDGRKPAANSYRVISGYQLDQNTFTNLD